MYLYRESDIGADYILRTITFGFSTSPLELPLPPPPSEMVSRKKILSRSRDDLHNFQPPEEEEDVWYNKDKLYKVREICKNFRRKLFIVYTHI